MNYPNLFSPIKIRGLELKNRVMMPGMATKLSKGKFITQELIDYHEARARGGVGLNFLGATAVHEPSSILHFPSIGDNKYIEGMKKLTDAVHQAGGKIGVQMWQGGLVAPLFNPEADAIIPSDFEMAVTVVEGGDVLKFPATPIEKIKEVVAAYGEAARRAVEAGCDTLEIHMAHGYSTHVFLSPAFNQRTDQYGGSFENRMAYPLEVIDAVRANIPEDMPLFMRVVAQDDNLPNGLTTEDIIEFCNVSKKHGVDVIHVSRGNSFTAGTLESTPVDFPRSFNLDGAHKIKAGTGMVTIAVGRINDPQQAEDIIASGIDMVAMGRAHIADPCFCSKAKAGQDDDIIRCVGCNQGCNDVVATLDFNHITCLMNPSIGRENEFKVTVTDSPKNILVVGGGIAGIYAANMAKERGHNVTLVEKTESLGGQFVTAGKAPRKEEFAAAVENRGKYAKKIGVNILLNTLVSETLLDEVKPDYVIIANGSIPNVIPVPGAEKAYQALDVLNGKIAPEGDVVVIGGGLVGLEVAEYLHEKGQKVTIVEMLDEIAKEMGASRKGVVVPKITESGIVSHVNTKVVAIGDGNVQAEKDGKKLVIDAASVVMACGAKAVDNSELINLLSHKGIAYRIVGDAKRAGKALDAVADAAEAVLAI